MYHCHVEDVEHVHMGLTGMVFIRPHHLSPRWATAITPLTPGEKYAYYDASTRYDREYAIILTELNVENHWNDGHIQESDWSEYRSTFGLMNGRSWPDTIEPNGSFFDRDAIVPVTHPNGTWHNSQLSPGASLRLAHQPNSSLIQANAGEKVLLRISNLGFDEHSLVLPGMEMTMVGRDAKFLGQGRPDYFPTGDARDDITAKTYRVDLGPGESRDLIFTAPTPVSPAHDVYPFYDRSVLFLKKQASAGALDGYGAMRTEVHVHPANSLPPQAHPNQLFV
jgi:FtsP/CotA-like multicopper oxidase with cupredoxin domain